MNIGIIGLGLIGGSLALDLREGHTILGVSQRQDTCQHALARGIVHHASTDLSLMADADVIFLCTPLGALSSTVEQLVPVLSPTTIVTDVGSVKAPVVESIASKWSNFVGGHPMAGTAESGLDAAVSNLFVDRPYVLTPIDSTPPQAIETVTTIIAALQCRIYHCRPEEHDRAVAWISHLPVMISTTLIAACLSETEPVVLKLAQQLASSGFRDTSRVGGGNPELGMMMAQYNKQALLHALTHYRTHLDHVIDCVNHNQWQALYQLLQQTQQARPDFVD